MFLGPIFVCFADFLFVNSATHVHFEPDLEGGWQRFVINLVSTWVNFKFLGRQIV